MGQTDDCRGLPPKPCGVVGMCRIRGGGTPGQVGAFDAGACVILKWRLVKYLGEFVSSEI